MRWLWLVVVVTIAGCGGPRSKHSDKGGPVVVVDDEGNGPGGEEGCGFATCDDQNDCTVDDGAQDPLTCHTLCNYELAAHCAPAPGEEPACTRACRPPQSECMGVSESIDLQGCVTSCEYFPITTGACAPRSTDPDPDPDPDPEPDPVGPGGACGPGTQCPDATPYCLDGSCRQCVGAADCVADQLCLDGACVAAPSCNDTSCPDGYECVGGDCTAPVGKSCDPNVLASCPEGLFCDPGTNSCVNAGGDLGCGLCGAGCDCGPNLACNGFLCEGCSLTDPSRQCPDSMLCLEPIMAICFPF